MPKLIVVLPWPAAALFPNERPSWRKKAQAIAKARFDGRLAAIDAMNRQKWPKGVATARVQAVFFCRSKRRRDKDNFNASLKAYLDSLADAGVIANDSGFIPLPPEFKQDNDHRVELVVETLEA